MQRHTSKESEIKIPPNLLKNFNVYDILEPEKSGAKTSDATKVDKLIDIDDCSRDSGFQDSDLFLDKNRDFDLVDLYQNIFVTPGHIKKNEAIDEVDTSETTISNSKMFDAGFKQFFDLLESGKKIDWTNMDQSEEETYTQHKFIEKKPKILVPKVFKEPDSDPEDVINEVLTQKKIEKLVFDSISNSPKYDSSPKYDPSEAKRRESPKIKKSDVNPEPSHISSITGITRGSKFENGTNETVLRPSETYPVNDSLTNFKVKAIQKDEKIYKKKRLQKPDGQTANYTPGPDFYEKSVVLPQIMARLHARLDYLDEKGNQKKRLILDAGARPVKAEGTSNANVQVKKKPNNQVSSSLPKAKEQVVTKVTQNELPKKFTNIAGSSGIRSSKLNNISMKDEPQLCINKISKNIGIHTTDEPCKNCGKLPTPKKVESPAAAEYGKVSPVVLMEDCNKERLRNLKQSQMFKNFVLNGKFDY